MSQSASATNPTGSRPRKALFRVGAALVGLAPFVVLEALLATFDLGRPSLHDDPFVGFSAVYPLFVLNEEETQYEIPISRLKFFYPESFPRAKAANEYRIFCLGGSTVAGRPYQTETSFTTFLELALNTAAPERRWEVVNCGGISYASYRLAPIVKEVLEYKPDLFILYTGHNEFLEDRTYRSVKQSPWILAAPRAHLSRLRTTTLLRTAFHNWREGSGQPERKPELTAEVNALLDYRGGLEDYHRDAAWRQGVIAHYRANLQRIVRMGQDAGVPLVLVNPVCNLRSCPPFKSEHRAELTADELRQWTNLWSEARTLYRNNVRRALKLLRQAEAIDDQFAGLHYDIAKCSESIGLIGEARRAYVKAKELDVCPLRILAEMNDAVHEVSRNTGVPLVDVRALFASLSRDGTPGGDLLVDHVHPSIKGHQRIANALVAALTDQKIVSPPADWRQRSDARYREHVKSLGKGYFALGNERLKALRLWTQGRTGPPKSHRPMQR